jgi:hypothetical protein
MYLGLLYALEDLMVYGYVTNTKIKFIVVLGITDTAVRDVDMRILMRRLHAAYSAWVCNPFMHLDSAKLIRAPLFDQAIDHLVKQLAIN